MKQKQIIAMLFLGVFMISMLGVVSAATMSSPAANGYYKTTLFPVTITSAGKNVTNVTCYYNASGGTATVFLLQSLNSSADQQTYTATSALTLAEGTTFNVSCILQNSSLDTLTRLSAKGITTDGTNPSVDAKETSVEVTQPINYKLSDTNIDSCTIAHPNAAGTTVTENLQKSTSDYVQFLTTVAGSYVLTCTDLAGNSASDTVTASNPTGYAIPSAQAIPANGNFFTKEIFNIGSFAVQMWMLLAVIIGVVWYYNK